MKCFDVCDKKARDQLDKNVRALGHLCDVLHWNATRNNIAKENLSKDCKRISCMSRQRAFKTSDCRRTLLCIHIYNAVNVQSDEEKATSPSHNRSFLSFPLRQHRF